MSQEEAVNLKQCRSRAYSKVPAVMTRFVMGYNSKIFPQVNQKKRLHLNASLSQYLLKEWQGVYPTSLLTGILHLLHLPIIRHLAFMIKCTNRKTTDEPP